MPDHQGTIRDSAKRRVLDKFDWEDKPPCMNAKHWNMAQEFHFSKTQVEFAAERGCSKQSVEAIIKKVIFQYHASKHPDHTMMCRACRLEQKGKPTP